MELSGWGRYPRLDCAVRAPGTEAALTEALQTSPAIARGNGRAYGDSALARRNTVHMRRFNRMIAFDAETGQVTAEAGVLLADIITAFLPRGWFPAVTPGTKYVTLGGMIAADVHGKNHHLDGSFGTCLDWVEVMGPGGVVSRASRTENADLFAWTVGGMGLTGVILRAAFRLRRVQSGWINQTLLPAPDLGSAMDLFEANLDAPYSVAWIDCLATGPAQGRSLVMLGAHAAPADLPPRQSAARPFEVPMRRKRTLPFDVPSVALTPLTVRAFNALHYWNGSRNAGRSLVDWDSFFYPLDALLGWNRIYGRRGFAQFQCALPLETARDGLAALLGAIAASHQGSFLSVLKRFGPQESRFSFPMQGYTLALDFPITRRSLALMSDLDRITLAHCGRFYLAKDSRLSAATQTAADPRTTAFARMRAEGGLAAHFASAQSERLGL